MSEDGDVCTLCGRDEPHTVYICAVNIRAENDVLYGILRKIAEIDHVGKDHAFSACIELAKSALR